MKVICINNKPIGLSAHNESLKNLTVGNSYTVIMVDHEGVLLKEVKSTHETGAFRAEHFAELPEELEEVIIETKKEFV